MTLTIYTLLLRLLLPLALARLLWRSLSAPAYRRRIGERLALARSLPETADVWVHAVSVGEVQAAATLISHLLTRDPPLRVLVTTTTPTGAGRVTDLFGAAVTHRYTPFDLPGMVGRLLDRVRPRLILVMETEIWPNTLAEAERRRIPVVLANARLSARSARGYGRLQPLTRETLNRFDRIAAQGQADARRFLELGAAPQRVEVTGSIKFDQRLPASLQEQSEALRRTWEGRPVWVAASTHEGEEEPVLEAHRRVRAQVPNALLVLVPRHPERFDRVADLVTRAGFTLVRRSSRGSCATDTTVLLGDTMGELPVFLAAADAAFIGGSLVPVGGHNPLEASAVGVPVATGPQVFNFAAIVELLVSEDAAVLVQDAAGLADLMTRWLTDAAERARVGESGRRVVEQNRGALGRLIALIEPCLTDSEPPA
ncbi:MAG: lipid IV(A) 3-deoxy-D-manno-octulosonic acid transferase [Bdellovibrio bacteriovorus]